MANISKIDVEVRPSIGFQTVGYTVEVQFDKPLTIEDALQQVGPVRERLIQQAHADIEGLVAHRTESEVEQRAQAPQPPVNSGGLEWMTGTKPNGKGTFRFVASSSMDYKAFKAAATAQLAGLGLNPDEVDIFDDRTGKYGIESGNEAYSPGKLKAKDGTLLAKALQGKTIIGSVDFNADGTLKVSLSRDAKAAMQAMAIAANLQQLDATPF